MFSSVLNFTLGIWSRPINEKIYLNKRIHGFIEGHRLLSFTSAPIWHLQHFNKYWIVRLLLKSRREPVSETYLGRQLYSLNMFYWLFPNHIIKYTISKIHCTYRQVRSGGWAQLLTTMLRSQTYWHTAWSSLIIIGFLYGKNR